MTDLEKWVEETARFVAKVEAVSDRQRESRNKRAVREFLGMNPISLNTGPTTPALSRTNTEAGKPTATIEARGIEKVAWLSHWTRILNDELIKPVVNPGGNELETPIITVRKLGIRTPALISGSTHSIGGPNEIVFNAEYLDRPDHTALEILAHQLVHFWQQEQGDKPARINYHNAQFVDVCRRMGLHPLFNRGNHTTVPSTNGRFSRLLQEYGLKTAEEVILPLEYQDQNWWDYVEAVTSGQERTGKSSLRKWSCGCQSVRVGSKEFYASCKRCGNDFKLVSDIGINP